MKSRLLIVIAALVLVAPIASADTMNIYAPDAAGASWHSWTNINTTSAFWNRFSYDGGPCNIGYWLANTGACTKSPGFYNNAPNPGVSPDYLGIGATAFTFTGTGAPVTVTPRLQVSGLTPETKFGWVETATGTQHELFSGAVASGTSYTFTPSGDYGFYISIPGYWDISSNATYTERLSNGTQAWSHFAVFRFTDDHYIMGIEDWISNRQVVDGTVTGMYSDLDYQDLALELNFTSNVPEPTSMLLLGSGLIGAAAAARRRKKSGNR